MQACQVERVTLWFTVWFYAVVSAASAFYCQGRTQTTNFAAFANQLYTPYHPLRQPTNDLSTRLNAKGFAGAKPSGFGSRDSQKSKPPSKQAILKKLQKTYGGTSSQEIAQSTQRRIEHTIQSLPPHMNMAVQLYKQIKQWDAQMARLSLLQQASMNEQELQVSHRAKAMLAELLAEHSITEDDIHNALQRATWDASADAKAARSIIGSMPSDIAQRVDRACAVLAESIVGSDNAKCLDVGCGYGALVPHLTKANMKPAQICGVDLSEEMIRNAQELYPNVEFHAADFVHEYASSAKYDGIIFCAALHDFPDPLAALGKAASLLRTNGTLVVVHPQGGIHVAKQAEANPVLVKRKLPDEHELANYGESVGLELVVAPAVDGSIKDNDEGYLAVMRKR
ncbi:hypothetical protein MPSEU_000993200 [Mayamaea pseudoterrestris]|nr:hypothetical protein MPSEU_000993200 [Mayamaea pseudoterrestris]